jgi:aerobic-type carbon monoxide dehydrogenase small subunit (CoxS/CutS family)
MSKREPDTESIEQPTATETAKTGLSRRGFLKGAGITAAGTALIDGIQVFNQNAVAATTKNVREMGPGAASISLNINGRDHAVELEPNTTLADALRDHLGMTGTKVVCDRGACSACTVLLDKTPINSCMTLAVDVGDRKITTIEGIAQNGILHPLQVAFIKHDAMQCGFCTPGMVMSCAALLERKAKPSLQDVRQAVSGNLCRCGTYPKVFEATLETAGVISDPKPALNIS